MKSEDSLDSLSLAIDIVVWFRKHIVSYVKQKSWEASCVHRLHLPPSSFLEKEDEALKETEPLLMGIELLLASVASSVPFSSDHHKYGFVEIAHDL
ncbi:unnamed protein product [Arabidopsis thaliana]|uniref:Uncharacterized protein n=1 Tax=Arabidopsis thaliana TaxID=3702 RepID=A0A5S9WLK4_ARATH|nr:unnamed protein product [Arabidopsis thaliana]